MGNQIISVDWDRNLLLPLLLSELCQQGSEFRSFTNRQALAQEENNDQVGNTRLVCVGVLPWCCNIYKHMYVYLWSMSALPAIFLPHKNMKSLVIFWRPYFNVLVWHVLTTLLLKRRKSHGEILITGSYLSRI